MAHPDDSPQLEELVDTLGRASDAYKRHDDRPMESVAAWARRHAHETRGMLTLARVCERSDALRKEANAALIEWVAEANALKSIGEPASAAKEIPTATESEDTSDSEPTAT